MLKAMRRNITREEMTELIMEIRKRVPGIAIRTTLITGFPGETLEDVEELKEFLQLHKFDRVGIFTYSHEENTSAYDLVDDVPAEEKQRRAEEIMEVQQEISLVINQAKEGQILKVIIDKKEAGRWLGRTQFDSVEVDNEVVINTTKRLKSGDMVMVKITKAYDYDLEGELV
jgi:ribosomal protein S12 methylthiotransferase